MKWDNRSTLFPDGLRLKAPVRSQHHDVCRAHACRETTGMTTDHYTRSPDTLPVERWHRIRMSELDVRVRPCCLQPDTPVSSCLSHDPTAQGSLTQTSSCPKRRNKQPRHNSVCGSPRLMARFDTWLHQTAQLLQTVTFRPKTAHSCLPRDPARRASSTHLPRHSH